MHVPRLFAVVAVATALLLCLAGPAAAHASKSSEDGKVRVTWGWTSEPATTMKVNGLDLIVRDATGAGIAGLENANLTVSIHHGDDVLKVERLATQFGKGPGNYTSSEPITPTRPGIYTFRIAGTINGSPVNLEIPATHEMIDVSETYFPEPAAGSGDVDQRLAALEQEVAALKARSQTQSTTPATVTPQDRDSDVPAAGLLLGLVGIALAVAAFRRR